MAAAGTEDGRNRNAVEMGFIVKEASSKAKNFMSQESFPVRENGE